MRIGVDSSVLVAAIHANHPLHAVAVQWLVAALKRHELVVTHHTVLECYAVLTRLPGEWRISGDEAKRLLEGTIRNRMILAGYRPDWIWGAIEGMAERYVAGGRAYDAFVADLLKRSGCDAIATFNAAHFSDVASEFRILDPSRPEA